MLVASDNPQSNLSLALRNGQRYYNKPISKDQICVVVAHDRNGQFLSQKAGKGRILAIDLGEVLGYTDTATNY